MNYPVDNAFLLRNAVAFCRRYQLLMVISFLLGGLSAGVAAWQTVPVKHQISGIFLLEGFSGDARLNSAGERLMQFFRQKIDSLAVKTDIDCKIDLQIVAGTAAVHWNIDSAERECVENFSAGLPDFIQTYKSEYPGCKLNFSVDSKLSAVKDFKFAFFWITAGCCAGGFTGLLIAFIAVLILLVRDHSIKDIRCFSKSFSLLVLGVLPDSAVRKTADCSQAGNNDLFDRAIGSLRLNIQFCKHTAQRAFVIVVSAIERGNGSTITATHLAAALSDANCRVLLLNKENCNMEVSAQLARNMEALLSGYSKEYDFIIIDSPDIQSSSVPLIISKQADTVLLVCDYRDCPVYQLQVVLWRLRRTKVNIAGCVINHFPVNKQRQDYDFYQLTFRRYNS